MAELLTYPNFDDVNITSRSQTSLPIQAGDSSFTFDNTQDFIVNSYIVVGKKEHAELRQIKTIVGQLVTIFGTFSFNHLKGDDIIQLIGNSLRFYGATNVDGNPPPTENFTLLTNTTWENGNVIISPDKAESTFLHANGGSGWWYKVIYYNTNNTDSTDLEDSIAVRGGGYGHLVSFVEILNEAGIPLTETLDLTEVAQRRDEAESEVNGKLSSAGYIIPLQTKNGALYVPPIIAGITKRLAAGLLLSKNFGTTRPGAATDGKAKKDEARQQLAEIQLNDTVLVDISGKMLSKPALVDGWPDQTTTQITPDGKQTTGPLVTMDKVF